LYFGFSYQYHSSTGICGGKKWQWSRLSSSTSVLPSQYHSTIAPHTSSSTRCSYQKDKWAKLANLPNSCVFSGNREALGRRYFLLIPKGLTSDGWRHTHFHVLNTTTPQYPLAPRHLSICIMTPEYLLASWHLSIPWHHVTWVSACIMTPEYPLAPLSW
jgi:hypothetical protein